MKNAMLFTALELYSLSTLFSHPHIVIWDLHELLFHAVAVF